MPPHIWKENVITNTVSSGFIKRYKIERDRSVNIQAIAEEHYARYLDQEEEYMREVANQFSENNNNISLQ